MGGSESSALGLALDELAALCGARLEGEGSARVLGVATLEEAGPQDLSFLLHPRYTEQARASRAVALLVARPLADDPRPQLVHDNPYAALARLIEVYHPEVMPEPGVRDGALVDPAAETGPDVVLMTGAIVAAGARLGPRTVVGHGAVVEEGATVGADCRLGSGSVVGARCRLGDRVVLQPGAVIGSDGFGYAHVDGRWNKVPQVGIVELEDDVEIGANACVDRATLGATVVGAGTKVDNLVQVAHNVRIGEHAAVAAQVGISGSTRVGDGAELGGQVGLAGHITVGEGARIAAQSGVPRDVGPQEVVAGYPAIPIARWRRVVAALEKLDELRRVVAELQRSKGDG